MRVDLIDGTYELFRHHYGLPAAVREKGTQTAATRGVLTSVVVMLERGATHIGVATDHVIESFRNDLWPDYKSSEGMPEDIPPEARHWDVSVRGRDRLAATLAGERDLALLFRDLATLRADAPVLDAVEHLRWQGPAPELADVAGRIRAQGLVARVEAVAGTAIGPA